MTHRSSILAAAAAALPAVVGLQLLTSMLPAAAASPPDVSAGNAPDHATVAAGDPIGFTLTITNSATAGTAAGVTAAEPLPLGPSGSGVSWTIDHETGTRCMISATDGAQSGQELDCLSLSLAPGASYTVHVTSRTGAVSCAAYSGAARVTVPGQATSPLSASATTTVACPSDPVAVSADADQVAAGSAAGFTVSVANGGPGSVIGVQVVAPLPGGSGVQWAISPGYAGPGTCTISTGSAGQTLSCALGTLGPGTSASVHVTGATSGGTCSTLSVSATASSANGPTSQASASTSMACASVLGATTVPVPSTGAGTGGAQPAAMGLIACGVALGTVVVVRRRRCA